MQLVDSSPLFDVDNPLLHTQFVPYKPTKKLGGITRLLDSSWISSFCRSWAAGYVQRTGGEQETHAGEIPGAEQMEKNLPF